MVDLLWHQWSSIGVAGYSRPTQEWIIDPEALFLATTRFGRLDSRLMDESIDWLMKFGRRISLQRLQGLHRQWPGVADARVLSAIAEVLGGQIAHRKWRVMVDPTPQASEPESLFILGEGGEVPDFREAEPVFEKYGLLRGALELRGMSQTPDPRNPGNLIFALRALLGVNARAEIMAWLLSHESGHPAGIARSTGYFSKSIQQILNEMLESGQVASIRIGREKYYSVPRFYDWQALLYPQTNGQAAFPRWKDWIPLFSAITCFAETLGKPGLDKKSENFQAIQLREALGHATPALARAGRVYQMQATREMRGTALIAALLSDLESLIP